MIRESDNQGRRQELTIELEPIQGFNPEPDPLAIIRAYEQASPNAFKKYTGRLINTLFQPNFDGTPNRERKVVEEWTSTSTGGTSIGILAAGYFMRTRTTFINKSAEFGRALGKLKPIEPVEAYHNFMTDLIIGRNLGLVTAEPGKIPASEYANVYYRVTQRLAMLGLTYLPGYDRSGEKINAPLLYRKDTASITACYAGGRMLGVERGGVELLRLLEANGWTLFCAAVNQPESSKEKGMVLRDVVPTLPDDEIIPYLEANDVIDDRTDPKSIRQSYINCGNRSTREQQYGTIGENIMDLADAQEMNVSHEDHQRLNNPVKFAQEDPIGWEGLLNRYIVTWQRLLYAQEDPYTAIFLNPAEISVKRLEPRSWFEAHDVVKLLEEQASITENPGLIAGLQEFGLWP